MKNIKNTIVKYFILLSLPLGGVGGGSCTDFFEPETEDALRGDAYMSSWTEMTTGYLGILTKMQDVGDKEIYLTDTRGEMLEPTEQSVAELIAIYNYEDDLSGNSYADPAGYYDVVIACNDYISKMVTFHHDYPELIKEDPTIFEGLFASAIRVKAWAYMTLAEIYGQALWFDDPIHSIKDVNDQSIFTLASAEEVVGKCIDLLSNDYRCNTMTIKTSADFSWQDWISPDKETTDYRFWDQMTPPYNALMARLKIWDAAFQDAKGNVQAAQADYQYVADIILAMLNNQFAKNMTYWKRGARTKSNLGSFWNYKTPYQEEIVSAIIYDYEKNQTNSLLHHFSMKYPNKYLLAQSERGIEYLKSDSINPLGVSSEDKRLSLLNKQYDGKPYIAKYRPEDSSVRPNAWQDDVHIYTFRSAELYLWLAEALNHLGRYEALNRVLNKGFNADDATLLAAVMEGKLDALTGDQYFQYKGFSSYWESTSTGKRFQGIRGCFEIGAVEIWNAQSHKAADAQRHNDELIANEWMLECACEGKSYPNIIRFAERYQDAGIVSSRMTPKYGDKGKSIEAKIKAVNNGIKGYYVPWNLKQ